MALRLVMASVLLMALGACSAADESGDAAASTESVSTSSPSGPLQVEIAVGSGELVYPFEFVASGPAVDEGMICAGGDVEEADSPGIFVGNTFVCEDGSGSFVTETVVDTRGFEGEGLPVSDWRVVSGTGSYEKLQGEGSHRYLAPADAYAEGPLQAVLQILTGSTQNYDDA